MKTCHFQPRRLRRSRDNLMVDFPALENQHVEICLEMDKTIVKKLEERVRLQEVGQARPPRALSLSKHQLSYHLGEAELRKPYLPGAQYFRMQNA